MRLAARLGIEIEIAPARDTREGPPQVRREVRRRLQYKRADASRTFCLGRLPRWEKTASRAARGRALETSRLTTDKREVDFVVLRDRKPLFAVECKSGERAIGAAT